jgi:hypothetical protein
MEKKNAPAAVAPEPVASEPVASEAIAAKPVAFEGGASKRGASVNCASLKGDGPLHKIGDCLLANEEYVDTYSALRQVCINWRSDWVDESSPTKDIDEEDWGEGKFSIEDHSLRCITPFNGELYAIAVNVNQFGTLVCTNNVQLEQRASTVNM